MIEPNGAARAGWRDPEADFPPLRTRILLRLSEEFRARHRIEPTCAEGYVIAPGTPRLRGFCTVVGPHITGWMPLPCKTPPRPERDDGLDQQVAQTLSRIGEAIRLREARR